MRIYTSQSDPLDFCNDCAPCEVTAEELYGNLGEGPDDRGNCFGYDEERPCYDDDIDSEYRCETCGNNLTEDNA